MNALKMVGIVLLVGGFLGLAYGGFTYTKDTHEAKIGPLTLSVVEKDSVNIPIWAGVGAILIGGLLLVYGSKRELAPKAGHGAGDGSSRSASRRTTS